MALWAQTMGLVAEIAPGGGLGGVLGAAGPAGAGPGGAGSPVGPSLSDRTGPLLYGFLCAPGCDECQCSNPACHCDGPLPPGYGMHGCLDGFCCC